MVLDATNCEPEDHRPGNELHRLAETGDGQEQQDDSRHHRHHQQAGQALLGDDAGDDDDEGAGRAADLDARAAQERHEEAADNRGVDARLRRDAGGHAEGHRQRQRDHAHGQAGQQVR